MTTRIGVYDSGVGGLTVLDALLHEAPEADVEYVYLGDTALMPYGRKPHALVAERASQVLNWFADQGIQTVVVACNTVGTALMDDEAPGGLVPEGIRAYEPIGPMCRDLLDSRKWTHVGLMATAATVHHQGYEKGMTREARRLGPAIRPIRFYTMACDGLATLIERGETGDCGTLLGHFLAPLLACHPQALILGCTHYPHIADRIAEVMSVHAGEPVPLLDPGHALAASVARDLKLHEARGGVPSVSYFVTEGPEAFREVSQRLPLTALRVDQVAMVQSLAGLVPALESRYQIERSA